MTRPVAVHWFRRDLRLADHPALAAAAAEGDVLALFVLDPRFLERAGSNRLRFLFGCLDQLDEAMDGALRVVAGDPVDVVPAIAASSDAVAVFATEDFGPYGRKRDDAVARALRGDGRSLQLVGSAYAVDPGRVLKDDGAPYAVFTPFARSWSKALPGEPIGVPEVRWSRVGEATRPPWPEVASEDAELPEAGEDAAHRRWEAFVAGGLDAYSSDRDRPDRPGTSGLSPYLRFGLVHPRQLLADLGARRSHEVYANELGWREFYADVLFHQPLTAWHNLDHRMDGLAVDTDRAARARLDRWRHGTTGVPIVDAGMRQLLATGWMHNRLRMITASFLVKDLHLPWQWGARHFLVELVDGDLASNNHGWQWTAGTGTDPAPYFRIFNPVTQSKRFDPDGAYIRRWVPELASVDDDLVHAPWTSKRGAPDSYPPPMVDHAEEREEALRRYNATRV